MTFLFIINVLRLYIFLINPQFQEHALIMHKRYRYHTHNTISLYNPFFASLRTLHSNVAPNGFYIMCNTTPLPISCACFDAPEKEYSVKTISIYSCTSQIVLLAINSCGREPVFTHTHTHIFLMHLFNAFIYRITFR